MKQIIEHRFEEDSLILFNHTFPDVYRAVVTLTEKPQRLTIVVFCELAFMNELPVSENKRIIFIKVPASEKEVRERLLQISGRRIRRDSTYFWGNDDRMKGVKNILIRQKWNSLPIHIRGEIGTGKSQLARWIAEESGLMERFVSVNCSGLSHENLGMDKLFGHVEGAYTDARRKRRGLIGEADGGILFLDEIQDLPQGAISNLLTVIETGRWRPIGADRMEQSRFRLITASSASKDELYERLGAALMSRIEGICLDIPPLRDRKDDIPLLIERLKSRLSPAAREFDITDIEPWKRYPWPNNVRELRYKMEYYGSSGMLPPEMLS